MKKEITITGHEELGPAMSQLTDKQQKFVYALAAFGGDAKKAAGAAGYSPGADKERSHLGVEAWRNMHNPKVIAAIQEEAGKRMSGAGLIASSKLIEFAEGRPNANGVPSVAEAVQLKAVIELANRSGLSSIQKIEVTHKVERTDREMEAYIVELGRQQGLTPLQALGYEPAKEAAIEGEFEEIDGSEGLEDLL